ncbi:MAG: hypothetical protein CVV47_08945 [Spirochaetae bacterium HGW-Spirochaetae-3]|jgi:probable DNA metabolism protein|nr:MAG: hypothetical protein CVV47_08945 [Spirochaetae bacterium HGW-Spirochaetae-3]
MPETRAYEDGDATLSHDGSLPGFLCACAEALNAPFPAPRVVEGRSPEGLFEMRIAVARDDARAAALWDRLTRRAGPDAMRILLEAFLSELPDARRDVAAAMRRLRAEGSKALGDLGDPVMLAVDKAANRARREAERMAGLVRFAELSDGSWYAPLEPDCDILPLISDHFAARFGTMRFALHDLRRGSAAMHEPNGRWSLVEGFVFAPPPEPAGGAYSGREREVRLLWRLYFDAVSIEARTNPRLQMSKMPKKYWSLLVEMNG